MMTLLHSSVAYVALSRATCLAGLQVLNFHPSMFASILFLASNRSLSPCHSVMAHPKVLEYYKQLDGNKVSLPEPTSSAPEPNDEFDGFDDEEAIASYNAADLGPSITKRGLV